ncbi:MAG: ABC transporter substrate-binding protein [Burkholderiales bacterium]|nr:MAG: ABC transporter substrate-binding protein [Burkholderiales bacterium]
MFRKLAVLLTCAAALAAPFGTSAQANRDSVVLAMTLEPPGLDPTAGAAAAIAEITLYNIFETLTKVNSDGSVRPLLAESWSISDDLKTYTFKLRRGVRYQNGEPFSSANVKFSFERAAGEKSTNKDKRTFAGMAGIETPDAHTVAITLKQTNPDFLFLMGQATSILVDPKSADTNATQPVGTGPYKLANWAKGSAITLTRSESFRDPKSVAIGNVTFRIISDPAAQVASLLSGDVDAFPRVSAARSLAQFRADPRFQILVGGSRAKTILAMNNKKKPFDDIRVRRAVAAAIDRKAVIEGAADGFGVPIGSHYVPGAFGYVDTTGVNAYDPEKAKRLLAEAGVSTPLEVSLILPPPPYARQGGEVIAALLAKVGIVASIQNVEWAQWLSSVYRAKNYDLTIVSHVEPFDLGNFGKKGYYWGYESEKFDELFDKVNHTGDDQERARLMGEIQRLIANDSPLAFLYQPQWITVANAKLKGLWKDMPLFCNDLSALRWE